MATLQIVFGHLGAHTKVGAIEIDATISQGHQGQNEVTDHPVERGINIADHSRPKPDTIQIDGVISNTPISVNQKRRAIFLLGTENLTDPATGDPVNPQTSSRADTLEGVTGRAETVATQLRDLKDKGELLMVVTRLRTYENMLIESLSFPVDRTTGESVRFSVTLKQVRIVDNKVTEREVPRQPIGKKKTNQGKKEAKPTDEPTKVKVNKSILKHTVQGDFEGAADRGLGELKEVVSFVGG